MKIKIPFIPAVGIIALIALLVGTVVVLGILAIRGKSVPLYSFEAPKPKDKTVDWKTYTSKKMGFSIKLPPSFLDPAPDPYSTYLDSPVVVKDTWQDALTSSFIEDTYTLKIDIISWTKFTKDIQNFEEWINNQEKEIGEDKLIPREEITLDNITATRMTWLYEDPPYRDKNIGIYAERDNRMYLIIGKIFILKGEEEKYISMFDEILSTFKFND